MHNHSLCEPRTHINQWEHRCNIISTIVQSSTLLSGNNTNILPLLWNSTAIETNGIPVIERVASAVFHACQPSSQSLTAFRRHSSSIWACQCNKCVSSTISCHCTRRCIAMLRLRFKIAHDFTHSSFQEFLKLRLILQPFSWLFISGMLIIASLL